MNKMVGSVENIRNNIRIRQIFLGSTISIISSMILLLLFAMILIKSNVQENTIVPVVLVIMACSILIGSSICSMKLKKNGVVNGAIIGAVYIGILYILSSVFVTSFAINMKTVLAIIVALVFGAIGGCLGVNIKK